MYHRPYKLIVRDPMEKMRIYHCRSTYSTKQKAIDAAWRWVERGFCATIQHKVQGLVFHADADTYPVGYHDIPF